MHIFDTNYYDTTVVFTWKVKLTEGGLGLGFCISIMLRVSILVRTRSYYRKRASPERPMRVEIQFSIDY